MSLLSSSSGALLSLSEGLADENCSDACCGGGGGECSIVQLVACECADVAFVCLPDGYLSCQPGEPDFGPPAIGTVVRVGAAGPYPGRCWEVVEHWDEWPDLSGFVNPPLVYLKEEIDGCVGGCADEACAPYSHLCPPGTCGVEICRGWQDFAPDSCGYITDALRLRVDEVVVVGTAQINLVLDGESIAGPGNTVGAPAGATLESMHATLAYNVVVTTRFRFVAGSGLVCVSNQMDLHYVLDAVLDRPFADPAHQHVEIHNDYTLLGTGCPIAGPGSPTVTNPCGFPVAVLGADPPDCGGVNECLFNGSHNVRELKCGPDPVGSSAFWDRFWQITRAVCAAFEWQDRFPYTCDETYTLEDTHTTLGSNGCGVQNDTTDTLRLSALPRSLRKRTERHRNEQLVVVTCVAGPGGTQVSSTDTSNYQCSAAVQQRVIWSRCAESGATERGGDEETKRRRDEVGTLHDPAALEVIRRMTQPCAGCGG